MIREALRRLGKLLASARLAIWLLVVVGVWSMVASFIPQTRDSAQDVATWASAHPVLEPVVRALGLHEAFTAWVFMACVFVLAVSTGMCAWRRTKVAIARARKLRQAAASSEESLSADHDFEVACDPARSRADVLSAASAALGRLGVPTKRRGDLLIAVSARWSVWGSPVFHWALVALTVVILLGSLQRSEGLMGLAVGQTKADAADSYGLLHTGPLHSWGNVHREIRVDAFELRYRTGEIDRGPTPTVSVLDAKGDVIKRQRVYPNNPLKSGSLTIHPAAYGLSATFTLLSAQGVVTARAVQLVDFSAETTYGTVPAAYMTIADSAGNPLAHLGISVPLDRRNGAPVEAMPKNPTVRVVTTSPDGATTLDRVIAPGAEVALPTGDTLRIGSIGYYARINVVDDQSILLMYAAFALAMIGLTLSLVARQQIVLATVVEGPEGPKLAATVRLWRNTPTSRGEIQKELSEALCGDGKEGMS